MKMFTEIREFGHDDIIPLLLITCNQMCTRDIIVLLNESTLIHV